MTRDERGKKQENMIKKELVMKDGREREKNGRRTNKNGWREGERKEGRKEGRECDEENG